MCEVQRVVPNARIGTLGSFAGSEHTSRRGVVMGVEKGMGREEKRHLVRREKAKKAILSLGEDWQEREWRLRKGSTHVSDHCNTVLLVLESLAPSIQLTGQ